MNSTDQVAINDTRTERGYDSLAHWYSILERVRFGKILHRARLALLDRIPPSGHALFVGDGDGRLLEAFLQVQPNCQVTSIDISQNMLDLQKQRVKKIDCADRCRFVHADISDYQLPQQYDLVVTAFHLDCFSEQPLTKVVDKLSDGLVVGGVWYVVDFQVPTSGWEQYWAKFWSRMMIAFFRWRTNLETSHLIDPRPYLSSCGFQLLHEQLNWNRFTFSSLFSKTES